ncbi:MAG: hypothetical protein J5J00_17305 [Deltaproteobacteria bacterium]|nr:hypothetical protein [Deltaproteobacteria bacterium]
MPSPIIPSISTAASGELIQPQRTAAFDKQSQAAAASPAQAARASQASSQQATVIAKTDKERAPQVPKRTEGGFGSQPEKEEQEKRDGATSKSKTRSSVDSVDVIA